MKTAVKPDLKSKMFFVSRNYGNHNLLREKESNSVDFKFYQKVFVIIISFSTILIFPESPKELENICETYNSKKLCNVW